jgi:DNA-directed RNA polymerase delta subunit
MLDHADYDGIDNYVKRHGLQDASMAEQRRAKKYNINGGTKGDEDGGDENENHEGELEKARRELENAEDEDGEDDEDFDPGSEGESEGSGGSTSEEEQDGEGEEEEDARSDDQGSEGDLVRRELGSEAEDIDD